MRDDIEKMSGAAFFSLGLRPFFLGASVLAVLTMGIWLGVYRFDLPLTFSRLSPSFWHAHELIFGYALAVIAGFLLTAVKNWTGIQTLYGCKLGALFLLWASARIAFFFGDMFIKLAAIADLVFFGALLISVFMPILRAKQWRQLPIFSKLVLIGIGNIVFYAGVLGFLEQGMRWGIYTGFYLVLGLVLTMGRRVIPDFIERGVGYPVELKNRRWLDLCSMALFVMFFILDTFTPFKSVAGWLALGLFTLHCIRALGWHSYGIWTKPLLWGLYLAYLFLVLGFGLYALSTLTTIGAYFLAIHAFAVGGIGLVTISMMGRVSLGHTGRDVHSPPKLLTWALFLVTFASFVRVLIPMVDRQHYPTWIMLSAVLWIIGFMLFAYIYLPILTRSGVDDLPG